MGAETVRSGKRQTGAGAKHLNDPHRQQVGSGDGKA
jgi:hypothetical protein